MFFKDPKVREGVAVCLRGFVDLIFFFFLLLDVFRLVRFLPPRPCVVGVLVWNEFVCVVALH